MVLNLSDRLLDVSHCVCVIYCLIRDGGMPRQKNDRF